MIRSLVLCMLGTNVALAQQPAPRELAPPVWTSAESFSSIGGIRELADGRLIVLDAKDRRLVAVSADGQQIADIARQGAGPGEFRFANRLIAMPGDTTFVPDQSLRRFLVIDHTAKPATTMLFPPAIASALIMAHSADPQGRILFPSSFASRRDDGAVEDAPLMAWSHRTGRVDTVASVQLGRAMKVTVPGGVATYNIRFEPAVAWLPLSTGEIALLHPDGYREEIIAADGKRTMGPATPYERIRVHDDERLPVRVKEMIPDFKPPFWDGTPMAGPDGELWIQRSTAFGAPTRLYDVFDRKATRVRSLLLDKASRILAIGRRSVYVVRTDSDGLEWLERRPLPR